MASVSGAIPKKNKSSVNEKPTQCDSDRVFQKILMKLKNLCYNLDMDYVEPISLADKVLNGLYQGVTDDEIDDLAAETAANMTTTHPDYALLAGRIATSKLHRNTKNKFSDVINDLYAKVSANRKPSPMISDFHYKIVRKYAKRLNESIKNDQDYTYNFFGFKTLERSYLLRINGKVVERPQYMLMRLSIGIHGEAIDEIINTYNLLSKKYFTHASPTLFAAATCRPQLASCFILTIPEDSLEGIFQTIDRCARISKLGGGIGLNVSCVRAQGTRIEGIDGISNGIVPMLRTFNSVARYVDQKGNKRPGAFAIYIEPWHADIFEFLNLKKNTGKEELRARDLFYGLWIPDIFMERVKDDDLWSLMCPCQCPGLTDCYGKAFNDLYISYETEGRFKIKIKARELWHSIIEAQIETGMPYMLYKDACNMKSNQNNLGVIGCSNLCTEIIEYSSPNEVAVCNLASIAVNTFVKADKTFDFVRLKDIAKVLTYNLNKIIDINLYPIPETKISNKKHRPLGIGIQGLADAFILMRYPYESENAQLLNQQIFETIYYGALEASCELAKKSGAYDSYMGSPVSKGILQYDMWDKEPTDLWDWALLKANIKRYGIRNSLLLAPMPTAATAQILGNNESFEPYTSNIYTRRVLSGEFQVVNHHLIKDLVNLDLWDNNMKNLIIANNGSIQNIENIPKNIRDLYKTVWEIPISVTMKMAADRGAFIDQSQSFNLHIAEPSYSKITSIHFHGWSLGLKTGMYYLRTKPAANPIQFTIDKRCLRKTRKNVDIDSDEEVSSSTVADKEDDCLMCSS